MRQTELHLTDEDRKVVDEICRKGKHHAREVNRAHVLSCLDRGVLESRIMAVLGIGRTAIWRTRLAYLQGGTDLAVFDLARPGRPRRYDTNDEARVVALACSAPPAGQKRWTLAQLEYAARQEPGLDQMGQETVRRILKKNDLKPWRRVMWCIGALTSEYRQRMYDLLALYARPLHPTEPVICVDEKGFQLIEHSRVPLPMSSGRPAKVDYEYVRKGMSNLFVAVEAKAGRRVVRVTERRGKTNFVAFISELLTNTYAKARRVHLVVDNLNTHFKKCFDDVLGKAAADKLLRRVEFHYTPKHGSWLNMAEIEIGILDRQCLERGIGNRELLRTEVAAWQQDRNAQRRIIEWKFTRQDANRKMGHRYVL